MDSSQPEVRPSFGPPDPHVVHVQLPAFEGPLDLLLHLIQTHELDILDIPIRFITKRYLEYLNFLDTIAVDVASEYLVMAAVLAHIKSKMLLPRPPPNQEDDLAGEEEDPREELIRRLLEYQKYKQAAAELQTNGWVGQNALSRLPTPPPPREPGPLAPVPVYRLLDAFAKLLERQRIHLDHEVTFERLSITDRIHELLRHFGTRSSLSFEELFAENVSRFEIILTFLALLEMTRLQMTRLLQTDPLSPLHIELLIGETGASP